MTTPTFRRSLKAHILNATPAPERERPPGLTFYLSVFLVMLAVTIAAHLIWGSR